MTDKTQTMRTGAACRRWGIGLIAAVLMLVIPGAGVLHLWKDPDVILLVPEGQARWIRYREPSTLNAYLPERVTTVFRRQIRIEQLPEKAPLTLRALKTAEVYLNGQLRAPSHHDPRRWKEPRRVDLASGLVVGDNELRIVVTHENGHPALLAHCSEPWIVSDHRWQASHDGRRWLPALPVDDISPLSVSREFPRSDRALVSLLPLFVPLFALVCLWSLRGDASAGGMRWPPLSPGAVRWLLLGAWLAMAVNNFWKIPVPFGMDFPGHTQYISYVATYWRVPLATEGWQMFQPPLFYYLEAVLFRSFLPLFEPDTLVRLLKLLPLACGAAHVEISYRVCRLARPGRADLQVIGTLVGGLLPMNLYLSQSIGNEPLAGCLTALTILYACRTLSGDDRSNREGALIIGFTLGLAMLAKPTALLIVAPLVLFLSAALWQRGRSRGQRIRAVLRYLIVLLGAAFVVSGWYYLRNYIEMGRFFVGGWDASRDITWWMNPGYRTPGQFYHFGEALLYPVYSSIFGFWDALYSTLWSDGFPSSLISRKDLPWNPAFMTGGALLSLIPTAAISAGVVVALKKGEGPGLQMLRFSVLCGILYLSALVYLFTTVPILTSVKASYASGLTPCIALLATAGFDVLARRRPVRAVLYGLLACWSLCVYAAYVVV
ncbi:MAG: hypothetical protein AB1558_06515 [Thermodesulfobacteriota bacterium]